MSDFELLTLFNESAQLAESFTDRFMTVLFAFLVVSYLIAGKLDQLIAAFVVFLYSVMAVRYGVVYFNMTGDSIAMADLLRERAVEPESALSWLEIGPIQINLGWVLSLYILSYSLSLMFFFHMRRRTTEKNVLSV